MDLSYGSLNKFLEVSKLKSYYNNNTAGGYSSAVNKILGELPEAELSDVSIVDLDQAIRRFDNKSPGTLSSESMRAYKNRLVRIIEDFVSYQRDPINFRIRGANKTNTAPKEKKQTNGKPKNITIAKNSPIESPEADIPSSFKEERMTMHYPLRPELMVQLVLPKDLKLAEAKRLSAFLKTLCADYEEA